MLIAHTARATHKVKYFSANIQLFRSIFLSFLWRPMAFNDNNSSALVIQRLTGATAIQCHSLPFSFAPFSTRLKL